LGDFYPLEYLRGQLNTNLTDLTGIQQPTQENDNGFGI
jgi:hypothetical protein